MGKERPHLALYIGSLQKGGAERVMVNLAEYFYAQGYRVTFVTTYVQPPGSEYHVRGAAWTAREIPPIEAQKSGIRRILSGLPEEEITERRTENFRRRFALLERIWETLQPDLILSFSGKNNLMAAETAKRQGIPVIVSVRSNPAREYAGLPMRLSMLKTFRSAAGIVLQTEDAMRFFPGYLRKRAVILPNPMDAEFLETPPVKERDRTVVCVGRIDDNKNQRLLIEAFAEAVRTHKEYQLLLYGDGPAREEMEALAREKVPGNSVRFMGMTDHVAKRIARAGMFVLPSKQEGLPNALIEAMALGVPCIATDCPCGGPASLIRNGETGLLTPTDDVRAMTDALVRLMDDPPFAARLGQAGMYVREVYAPARVCAQWKAYLDGVMRRTT